MYHLFCNELNTLTTKKYKTIPSDSIQQKEHKKKYWIATATIVHNTCTKYIHKTSHQVLIDTHYLGNEDVRNVCQAVVKIFIIY